MDFPPVRENVGVKRSQSLSIQLLRDFMRIVHLSGALWSRSGPIPPHLTAGRRRNYLERAFLA